jgi:hypothetical protein
MKPISFFILLAFAFACGERLELEKFPVISLNPYKSPKMPYTLEKISRPLDRKITLALKGRSHVFMIGRLELTDIDSMLVPSYDVLLLQCERRSETVHMFVSIDRQKKQVLDYYLYYPHKLKLKTINFHSSTDFPKTVVRILLEEKFKERADKMYCIELDTNGMFELRDTVNTPDGIFNLQNPDCPLCGIFVAEKEGLKFILEVRNGFVADSNSYLFTVQTKEGCISKWVNMQTSFSNDEILLHSEIIIQHSKDCSIVKVNNYKSDCDETFKNQYRLENILKQNPNLKYY